MKKHGIILFTMVILWLSTQISLAESGKIRYSYAVRDGVEVYARMEDNSEVLATLSCMEPMEYLEDDQKEWILVKSLQDPNLTGYLKMEDATIWSDFVLYQTIPVYLTEDFDKRIGTIEPGEIVVILNYLGNEQEDIAWIVETKDIIGCIPPLQKGKDYEELFEIRRYISNEKEYRTKEKAEIKVQAEEDAAVLTVLGEGTQVNVVSWEKGRQIAKICFEYGETSMFGFIHSEKLVKNVEGGLS